MKIPIQLLELQQVPIWKQLEIEEALLRADQRNWCITNHGTPPAIVMGISGQTEQLLDIPLIEKVQIPVWKRFSGGGTVVVDENTFFVTFICGAASLDIVGFPSQIYAWTEKIYSKIFKNYPFELREHDYVFGNKKFGGNAQYISKDRWLHHTSFLWDYNPTLMNCLLMPSKRPHYRDTRTHSDFLCLLKDFLPHREYLFQELLKELKDHYLIEKIDLGDVMPILEEEYRRSTTLLDIDLYN